MYSFFTWVLMGFFTPIIGTTIENSYAIVTGGANGLGHQYAHYLLLNGAEAVAILDKDVRNGTKATMKLNDEFGENRAVFIPTDVSDPDQFEASFTAAVEYFGGLDIMINNAGILDDYGWSSMIDTNVKGVITGTLLAFDVMGKHKGGKGGTVINIASTFAFEACQYMPGYCATKYAVLGFSRGIALNFEDTGVAVKIMCPGATDTSMMRNDDQEFLEFLDRDVVLKFKHSQRLQKPEAVAKDVMRLIEDAPNGAIWVTVAGSPTLSLDIPQYTEWGTPV